MERRQIPGFYYDEDKGKYFRVLPNHVAPPESKYSKSNVEKEKTQSRKRRKLKDHQAKILKETVKRAPGLLSPYTRATLGREHGLLPIRSASNLRAEIFTSQLQRDNQVIIDACDSCGNRDSVYDFAIDPATDAIIWGVGRGNHGMLEYVYPTSSPINKTKVLGLYAFNSEISCVQITPSRLIAATTYSGDIYLSRLPSADVETESDAAIAWDASRFASTCTKPAQPELTLWSCMPNLADGPRDLVTAVGSSEDNRGHAYVLDGEGVTVTTWASKSPLRACTWLTANVTVLGGHSGWITLIDTRNNGTSRRFRNDGNITGFAKPMPGNDHQVLCTSNNTVSLYDVRMSGRRSDRLSDPIFRIDTPLSTEPQAIIDVDQTNSILARRDDDNTVVLYSMLNGKVLRGLETGAKPRVKRLRFLEDTDGDVGLWGCWGSSVEMWSFGGHYDDDEDGDILSD